MTQADLIDFIDGRPTDPLEGALAILDEAIAMYRPSHVFGLYSGGHDSLCSVHVAAQMPEFSGAVMINTGIGIEETREHARKTAKEQGWPFLEIGPLIHYRDIVLKHGFPGPAQHLPMYVQLKERCLDKLVRDHKVGRKDRIMLVTGVRKSESRKRMGTVKPINRIGAKVWVAPIVNWTDDDKHAYIQANNLPYNEIALKLCMSGECLCGAYARPEELAEIESVSPKTAAHIRMLMEEVKAAGKHWKWGTAPSQPSMTDPRQIDLPLCWSCESKREIE